MSDQPTARVVTVSDPAAEAQAYARRLGADVARDREAVEQAIQLRLDAVASGPSASDDADVLARAAEIRAGASATPVGDAELVRLRQLAAELARAERIRAHTERRVAERYDLAAMVAAPPGPVVDETRQAAASALVAAEVARDDAVAALAAAEDAVTAAETALAAAPAVPPTPADEAFGTPVTHPDADPPSAPTGYGPYDVAPASAYDPPTIHDHETRPPGHDTPIGYGTGADPGPGGHDDAETAAATPTGYGPYDVAPASAYDPPTIHDHETRPPGFDDGHDMPIGYGTGADPGPEEPAPGGHDEDGGNAAVDAAMDAWEAALVAKEHAEVHLTTAQARWEELVGPGVDPRDPNALLVEPPTPTEPQDLTSVSPTLAAVAGFHRKVQARWRVQWAAVGGGEPPEPELLDVALTGLDGHRRRAADELAQLERAEARAHATDALNRPLVIVEPRQWAAADDLGQLLGRLPGGAQVIVLQKR